MKIPAKREPRLALPRSMAKAALLFLSAGLVSGLASYGCTGPRLAYSPPSGISSFFSTLWPAASSAVSCAQTA